MAINFKKGSALSLAQTDKVVATTGATIVAGQVVRVANVNGVVEALAGASASPAPASDLLGFAINNTTDGDVIAAGKIGVFLLDGSSVVETDQAAATINLTNYPIGTTLTADTAGNVKVAGNGDKVIGQVEGVRNLPAVQTINGVKVQGTAAFLGIKLTA